MTTIASQITSLAIVYSTVYSGADQRKHQSSGLCAWNSPLTGEFPTQRANNTEMFPFNDYSMIQRLRKQASTHSTLSQMQYNTSSDRRMRSHVTANGRQFPHHSIILSMGICGVKCLMINTNYIILNAVTVFLPTSYIYSNRLDKGHQYKYIWWKL